jgi:hypothetical protein
VFFHILPLGLVCLRDYALRQAESTESTVQSCRR